MLQFSKKQTAALERWRALAPVSVSTSARPAPGAENLLCRTRRSPRPNAALPAAGGKWITPRAGVAARLRGRRQDPPRRHVRAGLRPRPLHQGRPRPESARFRPPVPAVHRGADRHHDGQRPRHGHPQSQARGLRHLRRLLRGHRPRRHRNVALPAQSHWRQRGPQRHLPPLPRRLLHRPRPLLRLVPRLDQPRHRLPPLPRPLLRARRCPRRLRRHPRPGRPQRRPYPRHPARQPSHPDPIPPPAGRSGAPTARGPTSTSPPLARRAPKRPSSASAPPASSPPRPPTKLAADGIAADAWVVNGLPLDPGRLEGLFQAVPRRHRHHRGRPHRHPRKGHPRVRRPRLAAPPTAGKSPSSTSASPIRASPPPKAISNSGSTSASMSPAAIAAVKALAL
jgi:hypothetical protein